MGELRDAYRARQGVGEAHLAAVCRSRCKPFGADRKNCQRRKKEEIKLTEQERWTSCLLTHSCPSKHKALRSCSSNWPTPSERSWAGLYRLHSQQLVCPGLRPPRRPSGASP